VCVYLFQCAPVVNRDHTTTLHSTHSLPLTTHAHTHTRTHTQGMGKFGLYEIFKYKYANMLGEETATKYKPFVFMAASASVCVYVNGIDCICESL
jgi:hypothetical protein